ncbi:hypothetical protein MSAN_00166200 [Mycena sanguinolenta]|uniref:Uncharacterized protein n=1 Tax=Mycena sanguinolenta TaxID=230812 RepID=A0A8H6ZEB4_9AGAR|nr:hypothetical protein MSAN_00166200 [Mycena sanguinolenta]
MISSKFPRDEWYAPPTPPASPIVDPSLLHPLPVPIAAWILFNVAGDASCRREKSRRAATDTSPKCVMLPVTRVSEIYGAMHQITETEALAKVKVKRFQRSTHGMTSFVVNTSCSCRRSYFCHSAVAA